MIKPLFQNVLVVVNTTEAAVNAVKYGILMSKLYNCRLKAVYVVDTATLKQLTLNKFFLQEESSEYEESLTSDGSRYLQYAQELGKTKGIKIDTELRRGAVWSEVITAADEMKADLILIGGIDALDNSNHDVLSSTYRQILLHAHCSVTMVREKLIEQLFKLA